MEGQTMQWVNKKKKKGQILHIKTKGYIYNQR